jgi:3-hydroxybutyryl-CoA dehydrogenase
MKIAVLADEFLKQELIATGIADSELIYWSSSVAELSYFPDADAVIDLLFEQNKRDTNELKNFLPRPVIINSVTKTIGELNLPLIRINGWPTFLERTVAEVACHNETDRTKVEKIFTALNRKTEWVPDVKGFISARVVSMIINEAYFALEEKVSSKKEIDLSMKLGTNYPYGPFEWADKIGLNKIAGLLTALSETEKRYQPASLLLKEISSE